MDINVIKTGSKGNLIKLSDGHTSIMLECGLSIGEIRKRGVRLGNVEGCLLSHEHKDHAYSANRLLDRGIPVYTSEGTAQNLNIKGRYYCKLVESRVKFGVGSFYIRPFELQHDAKEPLGYFIYSRETKERILFAIDTYYIEPLFPNLSYMLIECSYIESILSNKSDKLNDIYMQRLRQSHLSLSMLLDYLDKLDTSHLKQINILHTSDNAGDKDMIKKELIRATGVPVYVGANR